MGRAAVSEQVWLAIIAILPQLGVVVAGAGLVIRYREPLGAALTRVTSVSAMGFSLSLRADDVERAVERALASNQAAPGDVPLTGFGQQVAERAQRMARQLAGRTVLWVDDHPEGNRGERSLLRQLWIGTEVARDNVEAMQILHDPAVSIDAVISDVGRDDGSADGLALATEIGHVRSGLSVILYVRALDRSRGTPPGALGITNRPDELLNLVMDAMDRLPGSPTTR